MAKTFSENYYGKQFNKKAPTLKAENGENRQYLDFTIEGMNLEPIDITDIQAVVDRCSLYFTRCSEEGLRPGVASMCVWVGISRQRWQKWCNGAEMKSTHYAACNKINGVFDAMMEGYMQNGKINPVSGIFLMKNNHGYENDTPVHKEEKDTAIQERSMQDILKLASGKN